MAVYKYASNGRGRKVAPQVAGEEIERISAMGELTPKAVVDASRPEEAPLHPEFEWNDGIAAECWREEQARMLIRDIKVTIEVTDEPKEVRAYMAVERPSKVYQPTIKVLSDEELRSKALELAMRELHSFMNKYENLQELAGVIKAIRTFLEAS